MILTVRGGRSAVSPPPEFPIITPQVAGQSFPSNKPKVNKSGAAEHILSLGSPTAPVLRSVRSRNELFGLRHQFTALDKLGYSKAAIRSIRSRAS